MCGIAGIVGRQRIDRAHIQSITDELQHRGPDAQGIYVSDQGTVALGHTRLSVIDLSSRANQPMESGDGRLVIVFNGEIYNFKSIRKEILAFDPGSSFRTNSDTETILRAFQVWGSDMVARLEGMFSLAIYDKLSGKLFLARDRVGKKPLYYFAGPQLFVFGSELKAVLRHPAVCAASPLDTTSVHDFLHLGFVPEPKTIFENIRKFPAGFTGELNVDLSLSTTCYWRPEDYITARDVPSDITTTKLLRENVMRAVGKRMISDVPLGTYLSSGTDSSLITSMASEFCEGPLKTFTIGFKEKGFSEAALAADVARYLHTEHHEYILEESEAAGILDTYLRHFDEPFADTSAIPTMLVSKLARQEVKVVLTGDGGDELFQGYGSHRWAKRLANPVVRLLQGPGSLLLREFGNSRLKRISHLLERVDHAERRGHIYSQEQYFFSSKEIRERLLKNREGFTPFTYLDPPECNQLDEADKQALFDLKYYLKDDLLVKVDRASMYYGLECRCPLLDHEVVECALNLPGALKIRNRKGKWILKQLLKEFLPGNLAERPKMGFSVPLARWLKNDLGHLITTYLSHEAIESAGIVNSDYVERLKSSFQQGDDYLYHRIWLLIVLHKWLKENGR